MMQSLDQQFAHAHQYLEAGDPATAEALFRQLLNQHPSELAIAHNLAVSLYQQNRFREAAIQHSENVKRFPQHAASWRDLGQSMVAAGLSGDAQEVLRQAVERFPDDRESRFAWSLAALRNQDWATGWPAYEARWQADELAVRQLPNCPFWQGQALVRGATLHVLPEQGFGDQLMFARFLPLLQQFAERISYRPPAPLHTLFAHSFPMVDMLPPDGQATPVQPGDHCIPLSSLPGLLLGLAPAPPKVFPYLQPAPCPMDQQVALDAHLASLNPPFLAIVWRGNQTAQHLASRSLSLTDLLQAVPPFYQRTGHLVSLQKAPTPAEQATLATYGIPDCSNALTDFNATAHCLHAADALLSVDTAVVHLAGALGKPILLVQRPGGDWRWGQDDCGQAWYNDIHPIRMQT